MDEPLGSGIGAAIGMPGVLLMVIAVGMLIAAIVLRIQGQGEKRREYDLAVSYAQLNGWQRISRVSWRMFLKGTTLSVQQAVEDRSFLLKIEQDDNSIVVDGFSAASLAPSFGNCAYLNLVQAGIKVDKIRLDQERQEWGLVKV